MIQQKLYNQCRNPDKIELTMDHINLGYKIKKKPSDAILLTQPHAGLNLIAEDSNPSLVCQDQFDSKRLSC